jgi:hypothetical protein
MPERWVKKQGSKALACDSLLEESFHPNPSKFCCLASLPSPAQHRQLKYILCI